MSQKVETKKNTTEQIKEILSRFHNGESIMDLVKEFGMSSIRFFEILGQDPELENLYVRAQQGKAEKYVEEIIGIADTEEDPQKARNRIDARRWYATKMRPQKYGDRIDLNVNQTVDISAALKEARGRLLPQSDPQLVEAKQVIDITVAKPKDATGSKPVDDTAESQDAIKKELEELLK